MTKKKQRRKKIDDIAWIKCETNEFSVYDGGFWRAMASRKKKHNYIKIIKIQQTKIIL